MLLLKQFDGTSQCFLVKNWANTELGKEYDIFAEDGRIPTDSPSRCGGANG